MNDDSDVGRVGGDHGLAAAHQQHLRNQHHALILVQLRVVKLCDGARTLAMALGSVLQGAV